MKIQLRLSSDSDSSQGGLRMASPKPEYDLSSLKVKEITRVLHTLRLPDAMRRVLCTSTWHLSESTTPRDQAAVAKYLYEWAKMHKAPSPEWLYLMYLYFEYTKQCAQLQKNMFVYSNEFCSYEESLKTRRIALYEIHPYLHERDRLRFDEPDEVTFRCCVWTRKVQPIASNGILYDLAAYTSMTIRTFHIGNPFETSTKTGSQKKP